MWRWRDMTTSPGMRGTTQSWKGQEGPPLEPRRGARPCAHLDFRPLASSTGNGYISVVLSSLVCGYSSPRTLTQV